MKRIITFLLIIVLCVPLVVNADSGLDAKYDNSGSIGSSLLSGGSSLFSAGGELLGLQPGDDDYNTAHIIISIVCIIMFCVVTNIYIFKLIRPKITKKKWMIFGINIIPTGLFSLLCLLTNQPVALYLFLLIVYVIFFIPIILIIIKVRLKLRLKKAKEIDKTFNEEDFGNKVFDIYKEVQLAWMNFELDKVKDVISKDIYNDYKEKLKELKKDNQKNVMDNINFKKNKIVDIKVDNNTMIIDTELKVTCIDYIINDKEEVVKGKNDKINTYNYSLTFNKEINTNKYIMTDKSMKKQS